MTGSSPLSTHVPFLGLLISSHIAANEDCPKQGGITCEAIDESGKSSKRVFINFRNKNVVIARFRDKNVGIARFCDKNVVIAHFCDKNVVIARFRDKNVECLYRYYGVIEE